MSYEIITPVIDAVQITPNPANISGAVSVYLTISERTVILEPEIIHAGTMISGEELSWL